MPLQRNAAVLGLGLALLLPAADAAGVIRPFVHAGGRSTTTERQELDYDRGRPPDWRVTVSGGTSGAWDLGAGARYFPATHPDGRPTLGDPRWEIRLLIGVGGGDLKSTTIRGTRTAFPGGPPFEFTSRETYSYSTWNAGMRFHINPVRQAGVFFGPGVQSVKTSARREWTGPEGCFECGNATDASTTRYGQLELGALVRPVAGVPVHFEGYWVPNRFKLSTTHILESENWSTAVFPVFVRSFGARLVYDF